MFTVRVSATWSSFQSLYCTFELLHFVHTIYKTDRWCREAWRVRGRAAVPTYLYKYSNVNPTRTAPKGTSKIDAGTTRLPILL